MTAAPLHIGFLTPEYVTSKSGDGGLANYLKKTAHALVARGHRVTIVLLADGSKTWQDGPVEVQEVPWAGLPGFAARIPGFAALAPALRLYLSAGRMAAAVAKIHRARPFSLLQASSYCSPGLRLRGRVPVPVICRVSSYTPLWRSAYGRRRRFHELLTDWMEAKQVAGADAAFAPSRFISTAFARMEAVRPEVIPTPLESGAPERDASFYETHLRGRPYLLFFGTLSYIKGIGVIAGALPRILAAHPDLRVAFIGRDDGTPGGEPAFRRILDACPGMEARLFHHPAIPKSKLIPVIAHAEGVLMPSLVDNYPNACLEAQALGTPVVGSRDSSLDEMIADGETGFLSDNGSPESLGDAVERLLALGTDAKAAMRRALALRIEAIRGEDRIGALVAFYRRAIEAHGRNPGGRP